MATAPERQDPPMVAGERAMLTAWLAYERDTLKWKCDGLSPAELRRRAVPPSTLSLLGLVRHMADVERQWFRRVLAGEDVAYLHSSDERPDDDFDDVDRADPAEALATWRAECVTADAVIAAAASPDDIAVRPRRGAPVSLRWILVHMVEEYARHNGHADLIRQAIDGSTGY